MTAEQLNKIRWLGRVRRAEKTAADYAAIYRRKLENVHSLQRQYRICSTSGSRNIIEARIADLLESERLMNQKYAEAAMVTEEVHKAVQRIPDGRLSAVLNARYLLFLTHEQTAEMLGISANTAKRLHKQALDFLEIDTP
ncbi:MAG: hypothetical protein NC489_21195 [Ruminococcus flavefaciens]|nr:hypothetical protein [Ruminococcus flavefaciens]